jgi:hypothetical protein
LRRAAEGEEAPPSALTALEESEDETGLGTCVVCYEAPAEMVYTGCGHLCCCSGCSLLLPKCPICRVGGRAIKVFRP